MPTIDDRRSGGHDLLVIVQVVDKYTLGYMRYAARRKLLCGAQKGGAQIHDTKICAELSMHIIDVANTQSHAMPTMLFFGRLI